MEKENSQYIYEVENKIKKNDYIKSKLIKWWLRLSLKKKLSLYLAITIALLAISLITSFNIFYDHFKEFNIILQENNFNQKLNQAFEKQIETYHHYTTFKNDTNKIAYEKSTQNMKKYVKKLSLDLEKISKDKYIINKSIIKGYINYENQCNYVLTLSRNSDEFIKELYESTEIQPYIQQYIQQLINLSLHEADILYDEKIIFLNKIPFFFVGIGIFSLSVIVMMGYSIDSLILNPIMKLANVAQRITKSDYDAPDVVVINDDEVGQLVKAFNLMKQSTINAIITLREKHEVESRLHKEEMQRVNMEKMLHIVKMRLLQSQINPHFLFNTLNVISGMAKIEDANNTDEMIIRLSKLLRYNLKENRPIVSLSNELNVIKDYFYIQKKRFGSRINISLDIDVDEDITMVPTFTLQPLVENAVIHGICPKEEGGDINISVFSRRKKIYIIVSDTGVGIEEELLRKVRKEINIGNGSNIGIGVANVCARCKNIYSKSMFKIFSKKDVGTTVLIILNDGGVK